jgi:hypothetical protein
VAAACLAPRQGFGRDHGVKNSSSEPIARGSISGIKSAELVAASPWERPAISEIRDPWSGDVPARVVSERVSRIGLRARTKACNQKVPDSGRQTVSWTIEFDACGIPPSLIQLGVRVVAWISGA